MMKNLFCEVYMKSKAILSVLLASLICISTPTMHISAAIQPVDDGVLITDYDRDEEETEESSSADAVISNLSSDEVYQPDPINSDNDEAGYIIYNGKKYPTGYVAPENQIEVRNPSSPAQYDDSIEALYANDSLPSMFIPDDLPPLRNQSPYGTCWAFSSIAMAEMSLIRQGINTNPDLSELHLAYYAFNHKSDPLGGTQNDETNSDETSDRNVLDYGAGYYVAANTLSSWIGAASETVLPYSIADEVSEYGITENIAYEDVAHLKNWYQIALNHTEYSDAGVPTKRIIDYSGIRAAKELIMSNGAIGIVFSVLDPFAPETDSEVYSEDYNSFYTSSLGNGDHAVCVVGWDDSFSRDNFSGNEKPEADGAWLVRNSWASGEFADHQEFAGYFWMSYYSQGIFSEAYSFEFDNADNYDNNYQYDGSIGFSYVENNLHTEKMANIFKAHSPNGINGESLKAVSFCSMCPNTKYEVNIYTDLPSSSDPESGFLCSSCQGITSYAGYYTIPLNEEVILSPNESFSVVVSLSCDDEYVFIVDEATGQTTANKGESFRYDADACKWVDYGEAHNSNIKIKAFTDNLKTFDEIPPQDMYFSNIEDNKLSLKVAQDYNIVTQLLPRNSSYRKITWSSSDPSIIKVNNGVVTACSVGTAEITASIDKYQIIKKISVSVDDDYSVSIGDFGLNVGRNITIDYSITPNKFRLNKDFVSWSSSNPAVAVVNNGSVTALSVGEAIITLTIGNKTATAIVFCDPLEVDAFVSSDEKSRVTIKWNADKDVDTYIIYDLTDGNPNELSRVNLTPNKTVYEFTDDTYLNCSARKNLIYGIEMIIGSKRYGIFNYPVEVGPYDSIITYDTGEVEIDTSMLQRYWRNNSTISLKRLNDPEGYRFNGWFSDPQYTHYCDEITVNGDQTLYGQFIPVQYRIKYDANGGHGRKGVDFIKYNEEFQLPDNPYTKKDMSFVEWNTEKDGSGTSFQNMQTIKNLSLEENSIITLYAQWTYDPDMNITYDFSGVTVKHNNPKTCKKGQTINLSFPVS